MLTLPYTLNLLRNKNRERFRRHLSMSKTPSALLLLAFSRPEHHCLYWKPHPALKYLRLPDVNNDTPCSHHHSDPVSIYFLTWVFSLSCLAFSAASLRLALNWLRKTWLCANSSLSLTEPPNVRNYDLMIACSGLLYRVGGRIGDHPWSLLSRIPLLNGIAKAFDFSGAEN